MSNFYIMLEKFFGLTGVLWSGVFSDTSRRLIPLLSQFGIVFMPAWRNRSYQYPVVVHINFLILKANFPSSLFIREAARFDEGFRRDTQNSIPLRIWQITF